MAGFLGGGSSRSSRKSSTTLGAGTSGTVFSVSGKSGFIHQLCVNMGINSSSPMTITVDGTTYYSGNTNNVGTSQYMNAIGDWNNANTSSQDYLATTCDIAFKNSITITLTANASAAATVVVAYEVDA